jgi:formylglycine-generating enzyme required for sulfatase activity
VEDEYHANYEGAPNDGSAWGVGRTSNQGGLVREGSYKDGDPFKLRVTSRTKGASAHALIGVRCAR